MAFTLTEVVPWGRSFEEYVAMFALSGNDLTRRIVGCGDGPASFNSTLTRRGGNVVSVDPIYEFQADAIRDRIKKTFQNVIDQTRKNQQEFIWNTIGTVEELGHIRLKAMDEFIMDFPPGLRDGRYIPGSLPHLPFTEGEFDLAVCSHFLFLYSEKLSEDFHMQSIRELCRVAREARIFPLLELGSIKSRHIDVVVTRLKNEGYRATIERVQYEFQKGGNKLLRVFAP